MEMRLAAGKNHDSAWCKRGQLALVKDVSQPDLEQAGHHDVDAVLGVSMWHHLRIGRQLDPDLIGALLRRIAD
jgi:hypothetical protein